MPASKTNFIVLYRGSSQVYGTANIETALSSPPPDGFSMEDKMILFVTQEPENDELILRPIPKERVMNAEIKIPKTKKSMKNE